MHRFHRDRQQGPGSYNVKDTGSGIAPEHLGRIFERFYRVDRARSRTLGGTGLGLSIVKHIMALHGGDAIAESVIEQGSCFTLHIPRHECAQAEQLSIL